MKTFFNLGVCFILLGLLSTFVAAQESTTAIHHITLQSTNSVAVQSELEGENTLTMSLPDGTEVEEGDLIVQFDDTELRGRFEEQQAVLQMKIAEVRQAESALAMRQVQVESELAVAEQALVVARLRDEAFRSSEFSLAVIKAEAELQVATKRLEITFESYETVLAQFEATQCDQMTLNAARLAVTESEAMVTIAQASLAHLVGHVRPLREAELKLEICEAEAALIHAKTQFEHIAEGLRAGIEAAKVSIQLAEAKLQNLEDQLEKCCIYAPISGVVANNFSYQYFAPGHATGSGGYRAGSNLMRIIDLSRLQAEVWLPDSNLPSLGQEIRVNINAFPDQDFIGVVAEILPRSENPPYEERMYSLIKINIENPDEKLLVGMTGTAEIDVSAAE